MKVVQMWFIFVPLVLMWYLFRTDWYIGPMLFFRHMYASILMLITSLKVKNIKCIGECAPRTWLQWYYSQKKRCFRFWLVTSLATCITRLLVSTPRGKQLLIRVISVCLRKAGCYRLKKLIEYRYQYFPKKYYLNTLLH
jgi:hypothetical protein